MACDDIQCRYSLCIEGQAVNAANQIKPKTLFKFSSAVSRQPQTVEGSS